MKATQRIATIASGVFAAMAMLSCGGPHSADTKAIDAYVEHSASAESRDLVMASGIYSDFSCYRDGNNIVTELTFVPSVCIENLPEGTLDDMEPVYVLLLSQDYNNNDVAREAIDVMSSDDADITFRFKDADGHSHDVSFKATDVASSASDATKAVEYFAALNNTPENKQAVLDTGAYADYDCRSEGYDIITEMTFVPAMTFESLPTDFFNNVKETLVEPVRDDYAGNDVAHIAIDAMKANNGSFHYIFKQADGQTREVVVGASEI